jgi:hypothetical protein
MAGRARALAWIAAPVLATVAVALVPCASPALASAQPRQPVAFADAGGNRAAQTRHQASGTVLAIDGRSLAIQTRARPMSMLGALTAAADAASGSVAAVLADAGLWPAGAGVPAGNGVIRQLRREKLIARGAGSGPDAVTFYDDPGVHISMSIGGRLFGAAGRSAGRSHAFRQWHLLPSVLARRTTYDRILGVRTAAGSGPASSAGLAIGESVSVVYTRAASGGLTAIQVSGPSGSTGAPAAG